MEFLAGQTLYKNTGIEKGIYAVIALPILLFAASRIFEEEIVGFVISLFSPEPDKGYVFYQDFIRLCFAELLWLGFFCGLVIIARQGRHRVATFLATLVSKHTGGTVFAIGAAFSIITILVIHIVLEDFPNSSDEFAYLFQAKTLSEGRLWEPPPDFQECFHFNHIVQQEDMRVGRFPPGWPIILSLSFLLDFPTWIVNPVLGVLCLTVLYFFAREFYSTRIAAWSVVATGLTGFYIFNAASYFSHVACLLACLLFVFCIHLYFQRGALRFILLAGFFLGWVILIRYFTAVLLFIPFLIYLVRQYKAKSLRMLFMLGLGALPCIALLGWYNMKITGSAFLPVTVWGYEEEGLGFVKDHTILAGIEHVIRWIFMFVYWSSPGLLVLYFMFLLKKITRGAPTPKRPEDYFFMTLMAGYFFYYQIGGNQYGPRFMFESLPFLVILVVRNAIAAKRGWVRAVFVASLVYALVKIPFISAREAKIIDQRQNVYDLVADNDIHHAVVLIGSHTSPIRPMPVGDLTRNSSAFNDDVLYAHDCEDRDALMRAYSDRTFYRYERELDSVRGKLQRIR